MINTGWKSGQNSDQEKARCQTGMFSPDCWKRHSRLFDSPHKAHRIGEKGAQAPPRSSHRKSEGIKALAITKTFVLLPKHTCHIVMLTVVSLVCNSRIDKLDIRFQMGSHQSPSSFSFSSQCWKITKKVFFCRWHNIFMVSKHCVSLRLPSCYWSENWEKGSSRDKRILYHLRPSMSLGFHFSFPPTSSRR